MARPVKITNIETRSHAQKLKRALSRTYPQYTITVERQEDGRLSLTATPPAKRRGLEGFVRSSDDTRCNADM